MKNKELTPMENGRVWAIIYLDKKFRILPGGLKTLVRNYHKGPWGQSEKMEDTIEGFIDMPKDLWEVKILDGNDAHVDDTHVEQHEVTQHFLCMKKPHPDGFLSDVLVLYNETVILPPDTVYEEGYLPYDPEFPKTPEDLESIHADALILSYNADHSLRLLWPINRRDSDNPDDSPLFEFS